MSLETTELRINERGDETHESWVLISANHVSSTPGARLFDSEIPHTHFIAVKVTRCTRKRDLSRDWLFAREVILELAMSQAQWGAFVSSFGRGTGVPATLEYLHGERIPSPPEDSRLDVSHKEVRNAGNKALKEIRAAYAEFAEAFETGGKKAQREKLHHLQAMIANGPSNMEFAAKSFTEHVETVITKARGDVEAMVQDAAEGRRIDAGALGLLGRGSA